jgi:hypothetical protein
MKYLTLFEMTNLPTHRLLAYKKKHFPNRDFLGNKLLGGWHYNCDCADCLQKMPFIRQYEHTYDNLKLVLSQREHVEKQCQQNKS